MLLVIKLCLTPLLIAASTLAGRRFGPSVGGVMAALPVISGSVSLFVAIEQGPSFAARTAGASLVGLGGLGWYCLGYAYASRRFGWSGSLALAVAAFAVGSLPVIPLADAPGLVTLALVVVTLAIVLRLMPPAPDADRPAPPAWDIPARMLTATVLVVAVTTLATTLGPSGSGLMAAFPSLFSVLLVFTHRHEGRARAVGVLRGFLAGLVATALFLAIVADAVVPLGIAATFILAAATCLGYQALAMRYLHVRSNHAVAADHTARPAPQSSAAP